MRLAIPQRSLGSLVARELKNMFVLHPAERGPLDASFAKALCSSEPCFRASLVKSFQRDGRAFFDPFHSGQYCIFLYWLEHALGRSAKIRPLATRVYGPLALPPASVLESRQLAAPARMGEGR